MAFGRLALGCPRLRMGTCDCLPANPRKPKVNASPGSLRLLSRVITSQLAGLARMRGFFIQQSTRKSANDPVPIGSMVLLYMLTFGVY